MIKKQNENNKIKAAKKIIAEEKKKIKLEKKAIKNKKKEKFKKSKFGKFFNKVFFPFSDDKNYYSFSEVLIVTILSLIVGAFACFSVLSIFAGGINYFKVSKDLKKIYDVYETIVDNYYGDIDKDDLIESAINGMVSSVGDVYTSYNDVDTTDSFDEMVSGIYEGIGCTIQQLEDSVRIAEVYDNSPASKAGLKEDDIIKTVDGYDALELGIDKLSDYIKNEAEGEISMLVLRDNQELTFTLERGKVEIPAVSSDVFSKNGKKIGYLKISIFSSVAATQFKTELAKLEEEGISGLIIDVRDNNGGYLTTVTDIVSELLPKGEIIYQMQKDNKTVVTKDKTSAQKEYPIAVITNENSASASEILAAAIKESYGGIVVGTTTYGKGTVQQVKKLSDGSMIKYTIENWLTPNGNWINEVGIEPTDEIIMDDEYYENPTTDNDNQLQGALVLVSK